MLWCFDFVFCLLRVWICLFADFLETWVLSGLSVLRFADSVCGFGLIQDRILEICVVWVWVELWCSGCPFWVLRILVVWFYFVDCGLTILVFRILGGLLDFGNLASIVVFGL